LLGEFCLLQLKRFRIRTIFTDAICCSKNKKKTSLKKLVFFVLKVESEKLSNLMIKELEKLNSLSI
jgi:hypothetical protein